MNYLTNCSIVKGEDPYIMDFYKIHKYLGVEKFLFFDRDQDHLSKIFKGYPDVEVIYYPEPWRHHQAWAEGVKHLQGKSRWVQFIDIDQVVVPVNTNDIKIMLQDFEDYGALALNWHTFGSGNREKEDLRYSSYTNYTMRARSDRWINNHIQSIVQVEKAETCQWGTPHNAPMKPGFNIHNTNGQVTGGYFSSPPVHEVGFVAHYYTRSREYWDNKINKLRADTGTRVDQLEPHWIAGLQSEGVDTSGNMFDVHNSYLNEVEDRTVANIWHEMNCK